MNSEEYEARMLKLAAQDSGLAAVLLDEYKEQEVPKAEQGPDNTFTLEFRQRKTTPGTVVFEEMREDDERPHTFYMINRLYEQAGRPAKIFMTIETE